MSATDYSQLVHAQEGFVDRRIFSDPDVYKAEMEQIFGAALRHVGVDLDNDWADALGEPGAIKGVNWLTIVGNSGLERLGGVTSLSSALDDAALVHRTKHGVVIQAGPVPATGDVNRGDDLPAYRAVYTAVRELHETMVDAATPFQMGRDDDEEPD